MAHGRMLAVHDVSCVGRCSLTVALPIISSLGIECSVLPTAVLSTHTGGFTGFTYRDLTNDLDDIQQHWKSLGLKFDSIYTGFLGSYEQIEIMENLIDEMASEVSTIYIDPVMGDVGQLYSVFDSNFPKGMFRLCQKADVLKPNVTELCFMLGIDYKPGPYSREFIQTLLDKAEVFNLRKIVISGVGYDNGKVGAVYKDYETGETGEVMRDQIEGFYHGTGDVFTSALVGCLETGLSLRDSVSCAVDFVVDSIVRTYVSDADSRYGVDFEQGLCDLSNRVRALSKGIGFEAVTTDYGVSRVAGLAAKIWPEAFDYIVPKGQIEYMVKNMQSFGPISESLKEGYDYYIIRSGDEDIGYIGLRKEDDRMFLSKLYLLKSYRGFGISHKAIDFIKELCIEDGISTVYLTVNRLNTRAINSYVSNGFRIVKQVDNPIGEGFEMNDFVMELKV